MNSHQDPNDPPEPSQGVETDAALPGPDPGEATSQADGDTSVPPGPPPPLGGATPIATANAPAGTATNFFGWLRGLGTIRGQDRWIGGVATGVATRTGLDPVLIRGILVFLAIFGGIGVLLYGLAWALLPEPDGRIHLESATRGTWTSGMTGAVVLTVIGLWRPNLPIFGGDGFGALFWTIFWVGAVVLAVYLVATRSSKKAEASGTTGQTYTVASEEQGQALPPGALPPPPLYSQLPPLPAPRHSPPAPRKPSTPKPTGAELALYLGGALIVVGSVLMLDYTGIIGLGSSVVPVAIAAGLILLGLGIVTLGIRGHTSGFLGFMAGVGIAAAVVAGSTFATGTITVGSSAVWTPTTEEPASEGYTVVAGQGTVDLSNLTNLDADVVVPVNSLAGNVGILIPDDVPVQVRSSIALGALSTVDNGQEATAGGMWHPAEIDLNENASGPSIILEIRGAMTHTTVAASQTELEDVGGISP
ncbi:PspC domain-containing protein [Arthrobacter sp. HLT1-21]